jgi:hypothetical protein
MVEAIRENQRAPALIHAQQRLLGLDAVALGHVRQDPLCDGLMGRYRAGCGKWCDPNRCASTPPVTPPWARRGYAPPRRWGRASG